MMGMNEDTGELITGDAWLAQAVSRSVRTPRASRVGMRWFGTNHLLYLARMISEASVLDLTEEVSASVERGVPGIRVETIAVDSSPDRISVEIKGKDIRKTVGV